MPNNGAISNYLDIISKWPTSIAVESQFFVYINIQDVGALKSLVFERIRALETGSGESRNAWFSNQSIINTLKKDEFHKANDIMGCIFADRVNIPSESIKASNQGLTYSGFQAPATMDYRNPQSKLTISFTETNMSFVDFVLRPWTILVGHYGFVTRTDPSKDVVCPYIDVVYLGKSGAFQSRPMIRKILRFHKAAPINVAGASNSYSSNSMQTVNVDFIYDYYSIEGEESNTLATSTGSSQFSEGKVTSAVFTQTSNQNAVSIQTTGGTIPTTKIYTNGNAYTSYNTNTTPFRLNPQSLPGANTGQGPVRQ